MSGLGLLREILRAYVLGAPWFAFLHVIVIFFIGMTMRKLLAETRSLKNWEPRHPGEGAAAVLSAFVEDSDRLGARGFVVPITDYSDRLDALVENIVDEVSERTALLLIVGIAGTIFGVFEFASRSLAVTSGDRLAKIGEILAASIAKAFPVGFVGLILMMAFQLAMALPISKLTEEARKATTRALRHRGEVSRTLADAVAASISEAMTPLTTLGSTISVHLDPLVSRLGERLDDSLSLVKSQFGAIDQSTRRFIQATADLQSSATALTNSAANLGELLKATPAVLAKTEKLQDAHLKVQDTQLKALEQISIGFQRNVALAAGLTEALQRIRASAEGLPEQLAHQTAQAIGSAFDRLAGQSAAVWVDLIREVTSNLQNEYVEFTGKTQSAMTGVHREMQGAAEEWRRLADSSQLLIAAPLSTGLKEIAEASERTIALTVDLAEAMKNVQDGVAGLPGRISEQTATALGPAFSSIAEKSVETWSRLIDGMAVDLQRDYAQYLSSSKDEVSNLNREMHAAAEEMQRVAANTVAFLTEPMQTAIEAVRTQASGALSDLDRFVRETYPAIRDDFGAMANEIKGTTEALAAVEARLRALKFEQRPGDAAAGTVEVLQEIRDLLFSQSMKPVGRGLLSRLLPTHWFDGK